MNLVDDRGIGAELHEKIDIGSRMVLTAGNGTEHLDAYRMSPDEERLYLIRTRNDDITDSGHGRILTLVIIEKCART